MKIGPWLESFYKKKFDPDGTKGFKVLDHSTGSTWNDGGSWNFTVVEVGGEVLSISMPSNYNYDKLDITKMKRVMREAYEPV
jgi:hypothetical protein